MLLYTIAWCLVTLQSKTEHWYRDLFLGLSAPLIVVIALEAAISALLGVVIGVYRACCCIGERCAKKEDVELN